MKEKLKMYNYFILKNIVNVGNYVYLINHFIDICFLKSTEINKKL